MTVQEVIDWLENVPDHDGPVFAYQASDGDGCLIVYPSDIYHELPYSCKILGLEHYNSKKTLVAIEVTEDFLCALTHAKDLLENHRENSNDYETISELIAKLTNSENHL